MLLPRPSALRVGAAALLLVPALAACSGTPGSGTPSGSVGAPSGAPVSASPGDLLNQAGLGDLVGFTGEGSADAVALVDALDSLPLAERPADLTASVRHDRLVLEHPSGRAELPFPADRFYLSVAPFVESTHTCHAHALTSCRGELAEEQFQVRATDEDGTVVLDEHRTTFENGFVGLWLPAGFSGTLRVTAEQGSGEVAVGTGPQDPTCLTTLQLA